VFRHLLSCVDPLHCWLMSRIRTRCTAAKSWPRRVRRRARPFQLASCVMTHAIAPPAAVANGNSSAAESYRSFSPRCTYAATFGGPASSEDELAGGPLRHDQPMSCGVPVFTFSRSSRSSSRSLEPCCSRSGFSTPKILTVSHRRSPDPAADGLGDHGHGVRLSRGDA
jgi:hypothetical protein